MCMGQRPKWADAGVAALEKILRKELCLADDAEVTVFDCVEQRYGYHISEVTIRKKMSCGGEFISSWMVSDTFAFATVCAMRNFVITHDVPAEVDPDTGEIELDEHAEAVTTLRWLLQAETTWHNPDKPRKKRSRPVVSS